MGRAIIGQFIPFEHKGIEHKLPTKMEVCHRCRGTGSHTNPNIDGNGLTREDFDADPDFEEAYFSGVYDVRCETCKGSNVVPVLDEERCDPKLLKAYYKAQDDAARDDASERWLRMAESGERF